MKKTRITQIIMSSSVGSGVQDTMPARNGETGAIEGLLSALVKRRYEAWLGILTFSIIALYIVLFWLLCPCCKALKRVISNEVKRSAEKINQKIEKLEQKKAAKRGDIREFQPLQEIRY